LICSPDVSGNCFLWPGHGGIRRGIAGPACKCVRWFLDGDPATTRDDPSPIALAAKTIVYADAKTAYFNALREAAPELVNIATGQGRAAS